MSVEWVKRCAYGLGSKPTRAILLCPWEKHFTALSPVWWSWQASSSKFQSYPYKIQADSNILACRVNCLPCLLAPLSLSCESGGQI